MNNGWYLFNNSVDDIACNKSDHLVEIQSIFNKKYIPFVALLKKKMEEEPTMVKVDYVERMNGQSNTFSSTPSNKMSGYGGGALNAKWTDETIRKLIRLWGERPALYDTKNELYFSKNKRREALEEICEEMEMGTQEIQLKMISLRTYYGSQHRKKLAWENNPSKTTPFSSRWQFWIPLQFLYDHMTQKQSENKASFAGDEESFSVSPDIIKVDDIEKGDTLCFVLLRPNVS